MAFEGETIGTGAPNVCTDDGNHPPVKLVNQVLMSAAGYYIGTQCDYCGPYSRESGYYPTREAAEKDLDTFTPRDIEFHPSEMKIIEINSPEELEQFFEDLHDGIPF